MRVLPAHRPSGSLLPDLLDWFPGLPPILNMRPVFDTHLIKVEDEISDGKYVVRAEIPGIDPVKEVEVTLRDGLLTIKAERSVRHQEKGRSEFSYGSFARTISLPAGANEDAVTADYVKGILSVTVPIAATTTAVKRVDITNSSD